MKLIYSLRYLKTGGYCISMPYYSFNMKKGKYQVEMKSDDIYFAKRQVDKLFEALLKKQGKLRVVLPPIEPEKAEKEAKELEKKEIIKETPPEILNTQEQQKKEPVKEQGIETVKTITETEKPVEKSVEKIEKDNPKEQELKAFSEEVEIIEKADKIFEEELLKEELEKNEAEAEISSTEIPMETAEAIIEEEPVPEEIEEEIAEITEEVTQGSLFENILAEKTKNIEEEQPEKETSPPKKTFSFKKIITEKLKNPNPDETPSRQKAGFKNSGIEEPKIQEIKPQDVILTEDEEDEEIAKILEEKIKKSLPQPENKTVFIDETDESEFEEIYNDTVNQNFNSLEELIALKNPQSKLDYLLLAAYYFQTGENLFKYSLKQLNSKIMPFLGSLIDHSIVHNAVAHDFIEIVPDYNGTAEVTEYRLTPVGENYLLNEL